MRFLDTILVIVDSNKQNFPGIVFQRFCILSVLNLLYRGSGFLTKGDTLSCVSKNIKYKILALLNELLQCCECFVWKLVIAFLLGCEAFHCIYTVLHS